MTRFLFFDTETNGLPLNYKAPVTDLANWPRLVQIGWIMTDEQGNVLDETEYIVCPDNWTIPKVASDVHRITQEKAEYEGYKVGTVLDEFREALLDCDYVVGHNITFDANIVGAEFLRYEVDPVPPRRRICTMKESTDYCKLPTKWGYKWPTLTELHTILFGTAFEEAHDAIADIRATAKCFFELVKLGVIRNTWRDSDGSHVEDGNDS